MTVDVINNAAETIESWKLNEKTEAVAETIESWKLNEKGEAVTASINEFVDTNPTAQATVAALSGWAAYVSSSVGSYLNPESN